MLQLLGSFPARGMVRQWLKAGVVEDGRLRRTEEGTPQGGVISPVLLNIALHGMEQAAGVRYYTMEFPRFAGQGDLPLKFWRRVSRVVRQSGGSDAPQVLRRSPPPGR